MKRTAMTLLAATHLLTGCSGNEKSADPEAGAILAVKSYIDLELDGLMAAATTLQSAAPAADADGWSPTSDSVAVASMKTQWAQARVRYEHVEGAIAVLFSGLDAATDERYDGFLADNGPDANLFDDQNVVGIHAIERILWSDSIAAPVMAFETSLTGFVIASFPDTLQEADDFKNKLCAKLVADTTLMHDQFEPLALDGATAFRGVIGSIEEQLEKVNLAATGEDESRYAQHTLTDMRANLAGGQATMAAFQEWFEDEGAEALAQDVNAELSAIGTTYGAIAGDGIPEPPATWNPDAPTPGDLATPYGQLWTLLNAEANPDDPTSVVAKMNELADLLGLPTLAE